MSKENDNLPQLEAFKTAVFFFLSQEGSLRYVSMKSVPMKNAPMKNPDAFECSTPVKTKIVKQIKTAKYSSL